MEIKKILLAVCLLSGSMISCTTPKEDSTSKEDSSLKEESITVTDMIGREVNVTPGSYQRVVCIGAGALRMFSYIGDTSLLAGVEDIENTSLSSRPKMFDGVARPYFMVNQELFATLPSCGTGGPQAQVVETEKILSCNPDIILSEYEDVTIANNLSNAIHKPVITLKYGQQGVFDENVKNSFDLLGKIFKSETKADTLNQFIADAKEEIQSKTATYKNENSPKVYMAGLGNWGTTNHLQTAKNYAPFQVANITNVCDNYLTANGVQPIETTAFLELGSSMDIMILDAAAIKNIKPLFAENPNMFSTCKAWINGEVYLQMAYNAYYTNLEIALINTYFNAKVVYPDAFKDMDMKTITNKVTKAFLDEELYDQICAYPNSFSGYQKIDTATFFA